MTQIRLLLALFSGYYIYRKLKLLLDQFEDDSNVDHLSEFNTIIQKFQPRTLQEKDTIEEIVVLVDELVDESSGGTVSGLVTDGSDPLEGITVKLLQNGDPVSGQDDIVTGSDGAYAFTQVEAGTYGVVAESDDYRQNVASDVEVVAGETTEQNFTMVLKSGTVSGTVTDSITTDPIGDAVVTIDGANVNSGVDGSYSISNVRVGTKTVSATKAGYEAYSNSSVVVTNDATVDHDIAMVAVP